MEFPDNGKEFVSFSLAILSIHQKSSKPSLPRWSFLQENLANEKSLGPPRLFFAFFNSFVPNVLFWWRLLCFPSHTVLHAVPFFGPLGVVEAVQRAHQIAGDATDALEGHPSAHHAVLHRQMAFLIPFHALIRFASDVNFFNLLFMCSNPFHNIYLAPNDYEIKTCI